MFIQDKILKICIFNSISFACQPAVTPSCTSAMAPVFHTTKVITSDLQNCYSDEHLFTAPWCFLLSFYLRSFHLHLQITHKKVRNL